MKYLSADAIRELGILQELNRLLLHPIGIAAEVNLEDGTLRMQDHRDSPDGVIYAEGVIDWRKSHAFSELAKARMEARTATLGFLIQPTPSKQ